MKGATKSLRGAPQIDSRSDAREGQIKVLWFGTPAVSSEDDLRAKAIRLLGRQREIIIGGITLYKSLIQSFKLLLGCRSLVVYTFDCKLDRLKFMLREKFKQKRKSLLLLSIVPLFAITGWTVRRNAQADDINEAVLRYMARGMKREKSLAFVSINGGDPSAAFLRRFQTGVPEILPHSQRVDHFDSHGDGWLLYMSDKSGRKGTALNFRPPQWKNSHTVHVQVDAHSGNAFSSGTKYTLEYQDGQWKVIGQEMAWIQ